MRRAAQIEPLVGTLGHIEEILAPPAHDYRQQLHQEMRDRMPALHFDTIVCVPWLRTGGADLVACQFAEAVRASRPDEKVLILRTDQPHLDRPDWIPDCIESVDVSDILDRAYGPDDELLLYIALRGLSPARIINVNSRRCWQVLKRFGKRLAPDTALYSYLFCWDVSEAGVRTGYPSDYFTDTADLLDAMLLDSRYLRDELIRTYRAPPSIQARLITLHSGARSPEAFPVVAQTSVLSSAQRPRPQVFWAGRLDRQKRFDLVQAVARQLTGVDFVCWGAPLLDAGPELARSPPNLTLRAPFEAFEELPLQTADLWLYTSAWDGMPTILIELAHRGVPIVASAVGGVPELIDKTTGWPVEEIDDPSAYATAIKAALADPPQRIERATALQRRAIMRYSKADFVGNVGRLLRTRREVGA
jgi:glycosyltransferase involved in cell wall biosynthesis